MCRIAQNSLSWAFSFVFAAFLSVQFARTSGLLCHCTVEHCTHENNTCKTDGACFAAISRTDNGSLLNIYGCFQSKQLFPVTKSAMCEEKLENFFTVVCCQNGSLCNRDILLELIKPEVLPIMTDGSNPQQVSEAKHFTPLQVALMVIAVLTGILLITVFLVICRHHLRHSTVVSLSEQKLLSMETGAKGMSLLHNVMETSSGSGPGVGLLIQRTIARQIQLEVVVGKGRFGEVWRAMWNGEHVAVKVFPSRDERSWFREVEIYQTVMLRHENILCFIAADNKDSGTWTQLWLITEYHLRGSLFDFLNQNTVDVLTMIKMTSSIASGLVHLHIDITGAMGKPGIAHRDIKSKNILVKSNGTCCIADLGLAVKHNFDENSVEIADNWRTGTRRYMAPEDLDKTIDTRQFESFKRADIYALGLVFWEIVRRTSVKGRCEEYQLPYYDMVSPDPTQDEMQKVVVVEKRRPNIPNKWQSIEALRTMSHLIKECWYHSPAARLSALRVKKTLLKLGQLEIIDIQNT